MSDAAEVHTERHRARRSRSIAQRLLIGQVLVLLTLVGGILLATILLGPRALANHLLESGHEHYHPGEIEEHMVFVRTGILALTIGMVAAIGIALLVSFLQARRISSTVDSLAAAARRAADGDYGAIVTRDSYVREVDVLTDSFSELSLQLADTEAGRKRLLADLAHEIRTPIASIQVTLDALEDGVVRPDEQALAALREQAERLTRLTNDLRALSSSEASYLTLHPEIISLGPIVDRTVHAFSENFVRNDITVDIAVPADLQAFADPSRTSQILTNLLSNAERHAPGGRIHIRGELRGDHAVLTVSDDGDGIAPHHIPHIFERFYRSDTARDRDHGGSGLGLTISRDLAERQGGTLTVTSAGIGKGATFELHLPSASSKLHR